MEIPDHLLQRARHARLQAEAIDGTVVMQTSVLEMNISTISLEAVTQ